MSLVRIQKHDRYQLELKFEYLNSDKGGEQAEMDLWLFLPPVFGVSTGMYTSSQVYSDLRTYTRLKTPRFDIHQMLTEPKSPLMILEKTTCQEIVIPEKQIRQEMKLLGGIARRLMLHNPSSEVTLYESLIQRWRIVLTDLSEQSTDPKTVKCTKIIDELLSNYWEMYLIDQSEMTEEGSQRDLLLAELEYRKNRQYYLFKEDCKEQYLFHYGNLTKFVNTVLFLQSKPDKFTDWLRHAALGMAAGLAMIWALFVQIYALVEFGVNLDSQMSLSLIVTFVAIGIFSYILKDRIKATSGQWLSGQISKRLPDHNRFYAISEEHAPVAEIAEAVKFAEEKLLPKDVLARYQDFKEWNPYFLFASDVLHYRREIKMFSKKAIKQFPRFQGLVEIHRFHVWNWIKVLAEPRKDIRVVTVEGLIHHCEAPRVYTVNLMARVKTSAGTTYQLAQVLMNSRGIVEIKEIKHLSDDTNHHR